VNKLARAATSCAYTIGFRRARRAFSGDTKSIGPTRSDENALDLIKRQLVVSAVIELGRSG
jgi:hypothetical protein